MGPLQPLAREPAAAPRVAWRLCVEGTVQGVGFRPFVYQLAREHALAGFVANTTRGVLIEIEGAASQLEDFVGALARRAPRNARVARVRRDTVLARGRREFEILESRAHGLGRVPVAPDLATCDECLRELFDPGDRRFRYAFLNCTRCGPRFTIARAVPYDRQRTTMADFALCSACSREYADPEDRRFHAQPTCCPACGPRLRLLRRDARGAAAEIAGDPVRGAAARLRAGEIVAIKGLGGYHLAALAGDAAAVAELRARKHREDKPFAVLVPDLAAARALAELDAAEEAALADSARPIVLARRRADAALAPAVAPRNRRIGLLLPYTPLHHLLCDALRAPCVLTSGNLSDEPIAYRDEDAFERLGAVADAFLVHDRPIHVRSDDSVVHVLRGRAQPLRRSRGVAPEPLPLPLRARRPLLACGGELKNTFCLVRDGEAYLSQHIGDLENHATLCAYEDAIEHYRRLFDVEPELVAHDLHPEYLSTRHALSLSGLERVGVQHHHAHVAACLADNGEAGPAIGVVFDGLGYGSDGTLWGGEFLVADLVGFERVAHFERLPMPGGEQAIRQPWRMACAVLGALHPGALPERLDVVERNRRHWDAVARLARLRSMSPLTSSVGRLFDAVASLVGVRDEVRYEAQAAVELEQLADLSEREAYRTPLGGQSPRIVAGSELFRAALEDLGAGVPVPRIAARFHNGLARCVVEVCREIRTRRGPLPVALSGGVFQNALLLERTLEGLEGAGFRALTHRRVPCNDGGLSFGQAVVAAARDQFQREA